MIHTTHEKLTSSLDFEQEFIFIIGNSISDKNKDFFLLIAGFALKTDCYLVWFKIFCTRSVIIDLLTI